MPVRSVASALVGLMLSVIAANARAVSPEAATLFREGRRLMAAGDIAKACVRFQQSYALEASSGTLLNLALCHEQEGKLATASSEYESAARLAREQHRDDRALAAEQRVLALKPKLAHLTVAATAPVPGLQVVIDRGAPGQVRLDAAVAIDSGVHEVQATAAGYAPWSAIVELKNGEQLTVTIPPIEAIATHAAREPAPAPESKPVVLARPAPAPTSPAPARSAGVDLYLALGGAVLVAAGAVAWGVAYEKFTSAKTACNEGPGCADYDSRVSSIRTFQGIAVGAWIAGGAALLVSGLHHVLRRSKATTTEIAISPWASRLDFRVSF
jgi:tetratricopeptide (TPR) repeat protein